MKKTRPGGGFPITPMKVEAHGLRVTPLVPLKDEGRSQLTTTRRSSLPLTPIMPITSMDALGSESSIDIQRKTGSTSKSRTLHDTSNLPQCTVQQRSRYEQNWEKILEPKMMTHLHGSKDVLHGGRSLNMLIADNDPENDLYRPSLDFDVFSKSAKKHSRKIEKQLDKSMGCNICDVVHVPIPQTSAREYDDMSADLYRVTTPATTKDAEVDFMDKPKNLPTVRYKRIYHESLEKQYEKATRGLMVPLRSFKSGLDRTRIREHYRRKGKKLKV